MAQELTYNQATLLRIRTAIKEALESGSTANIPVGYANPDNADDFKYFQIQYNFLTDSVKVLKQD